MDIGSLLLGLALLLVIALIVARPLLEQTGVREQPANPADQLIASREQVLTQLRDLDFDQATGKINQEDYAAQRGQLVAEGVAILKQLDALGIEAGQPATPSAAAPAMAPADEIEAAVAQLRARRASAAAIEPTLNRAPARAAPSPRNLDDEIEASVAERRAAGPAKQPTAAKLACAQCGADVQADDRFCPKCGSALTIACGNCGRAARAGDQFCAYCGQPLPTPVAAGQPVRQAKVQG
jgi:RNA polymerase subunit RPABC4/transcription elongation factor Spt4